MSIDTEVPVEWYFALADAEAGRIHPVDRVQDYRLRVIPIADEPKTSLCVLTGEQGVVKGWLSMILDGKKKRLPVSREDADLVLRLTRVIRTLELEDPIMDMIGEELDIPNLRGRVAALRYEPDLV